MTVLLQNLETLSYLCGERRWSYKADEAVDFREVIFAVDYALEAGLENVRVVVKFNDARLDIVLPAVGALAYRQV